MPHNAFRSASAREMIKHGSPSLPLKIGHPKRKLVFQPSVFRCCVSFREGTVNGNLYWVHIDILLTPFKGEWGFFVSIEDINFYATRMSEACCNGGAYGSQGNGPMLSIVRLLAKRATIMLGKVVTKSNNVYNSFTSSWIHAIHFHAIHGQCPYTCLRFNMNKLITRWLYMTYINVSHPPGLSRFIKFHYSMPPVWETLCHHLMTPKRLHHVRIWTMLCLTCFLGEVVSNCPTKYTNLPNNPTVVWFSAHLWVPLVDRQGSPKTSWAWFIVTGHHVQRSALHWLSGAVVNPILVYLGLTRARHFARNFDIYRQLLVAIPLHITGWLP